MALFGQKRQIIFSFPFIRLSFDDKRHWPSWIESTSHVAHFLMSFNSSVNFYVYCMKHFRICRHKSHHHHHNQENNTSPRGEHHRNQYPPHIQVTDVNDQALIIVQPAYSIEDKHLVNGNYNASTYV